MISEEKEVAKKLNTFFNNAVKSLGVSENPFILNSHYSEDSIESKLKKYKHHPSIIMIRDKISPSSFSFVEIDNSEMKKEIKNLNAKKAIPQNNIPVKHLKESSDVIFEVLSDIINK